MTDNLKPTSKIIQIALPQSSFEIVALCEDGSIWVKSDPRNGEIKWCCILEATDNGK